MAAFRLRAVFFDAGNTLIFPRLDQLANDLTARGYPATTEDFYASERAGKARLDAWLWPQIRNGKVPRAVDRMYWDEYYRVLMERIGVPEEAREALTQRVASGFRDIQTWSVVMPETPPFLDTLRAAGYFLGVISNSTGAMEEQLARLDLARRFEMILDSHIVGVEKPHPEIFQLALTRAGVRPSEALFVGDTHSIDVGGARLSGLHGALLDRVGAYNDLDCPRITTLPQLARVLESIPSD